MLEASTGAGWEAEERFPAGLWQPVQGCMGSRNANKGGRCEGKTRVESSSINPLEKASLGIGVKKNRGNRRIANGQNPWCGTTKHCTDGLRRHTQRLEL